ncbi:putative ABC transport system permease protein [Ekhidna lutea]|uniref:Putative ABC transport system permease protein n=1 Tax=Ekhidna lutea TaxID=447679 RepID=A0A239IPA4_EKHLU|nr:ABC transporter permease [Ekhidna lutea]SNS95606.1 putative ABC transport system permease protein [Ekhidna lutea]
MHQQPPKWPLKFLRWFCREDYLDEIEGDIIELFHYRSTKSQKTASLFLIWNVIRSLRWVNLKHAPVFKSGLIRNYFKVGFRALIKDRQFTAINLVGLSIGTAVFVAILLLVYHELSFDQFHSKSDRIFQVIQDFENHDGSDPEIYTSSQLADAVRQDFSFVENSVTIHGAASTWFDVSGKKFFEEEGIVSGPQFFQIFDFNLLSGDRNLVLKNKRSIVLCESLSRKFFGFENPIGKEVTLSHYGRFEVTGIMEDVPANSYIQFEYLISQDYETYFEQTAGWYPSWFLSWNGNGATTYVLLHEAADKVEFENQIPNLLRKYLDGEERPNRHFLLSLTDLHFGSNGIDGRVNHYVKGDLRQVYFLIVIACVVLSMACFNYINIATARAVRRSKEVGIRKTLGAFQHQVKTQFLVEVFVLVLVSFVLGLGIVSVLLPYFNTVTGIALELNTSLLLKTFPYLIGAIILVTLLAGSYPAFYLSAFNPVFILTKAKASSRFNSLLRNGLITLQYVLSILILSSLVVITRQYSLLSHASLGFDSEELVIVEINSGSVRDNFSLMKQELLTHPEIKNVAGLTRMISGYRSPTSISVTDPDEPEKAQPMRFYGMDEDGLETLGLSLKTGSNFSGDTRMDSLSIFMNEQAAKLFDGEESIGKWLEIDSDQNENFRARLIGIVKDFHFNSLHSPIEPVILGYFKNPFISLDDIVIKVRGNSLKETLSYIEEIHNEYDDNDIMTWEFADDMAQRAYQKELIFRDIFMGASVIAFCIVILGIIGLASYNVTVKSKEIGIRKILGASPTLILKKQASQFVMFIAIAAFLTIPLCIYISNKWLDNYAVRMDVSVFLFIPVLVAILIVTLLVVVAVANRIATSNPVNSIRNE